MTCIHKNKANKIAEYNLLHDILDSSKHIFKIAMNLLLYMSVWIHRRVEQSLRDFE